MILKIKVHVESSLIKKFYGITNITKNELFRSILHNNNDSNII